MRVTIAKDNDFGFGLCVGSAGCLVSVALATAEGAIRRLEEIRSAFGIDRLHLPDGKDVAAIATWAAAKGVAVDLVDADDVARNFCGADDATAGTVIAEAEARGFDVTDVEAQAIAAFDSVLGGPDVTRGRVSVIDTGASVQYGQYVHYVLYVQATEFTHENLLFVPHSCRKGRQLAH